MTISRSLESGSATSRLFVALVAAMVFAGTAQAQSLAAAVREASSKSGPSWITYRVPIVSGDRSICFDHMRTGRRDADDLHPPLAPAAGLVIYARVDHGRVERVRAFTPDCQVESEKTPVVPVAGVTGAESAAWLAAVASAADGDTRKVADEVLMALSLHADPSAVDRLVAIARDDGRPRVRGQALFWLAQRAGEKAATTIAAAVEQDPDTDVKKRAVFAISQLPKDEGVPKLIEIARTSRNPAVRKQAMFWLGQSGDPRAAGFFEEILRK
jgi:hypothetical protein